MIIVVLNVNFSEHVYMLHYIAVAMRYGDIASMGKKTVVLSLHCRSNTLPRCSTLL